MIEYATYNAMMHSNTISYTSSPINYKLNDTYHIITMHKISSRCRYPSSNPIFLSTDIFPPVEHRHGHFWEFFAFSALSTVQRMNILPLSVEFILLDSDTS